MGSTSGTRAGDRDTVPVVLFGDTIPAAAATTWNTPDKELAAEGATRRAAPSSVPPLLLLSAELLCLIVVASALFCLCCRY